MIKFRENCENIYISEKTRVGIRQFGGSVCFTTDQHSENR